jgi:glutathione S-transferase
MASARIILWHIGISHYSEKARWALEHKALAHERRTPPPGLHIAHAAWLRRGAGAVHVS